MPRSALSGGGVDAAWPAQHFWKNPPSYSGEKVWERNRPIRSPWTSKQERRVPETKVWWWEGEKWAGQRALWGVKAKEGGGGREMSRCLLASWIGIWGEEHRKRTEFWPWQGIWWGQKTRLCVYWDIHEMSAVQFYIPVLARKRGVA